jgi:DUF1680 family protein
MSQAQTNPVVVDTKNSTQARLLPLPITAVRLKDRFWAPRWAANRDVTLPSQYRLLEETGRIDNFRQAAGKINAPFRGLFFNDSDLYKWLEAAAWTLAFDPDPALTEMVDAAIGEVEAAQGPDGYLDNYYTGERAGQRWSNLRDMHELYCAGHLFQGAVAHYRATGDDRLLNIARRFADLICDTFGPEEEGKRPGTCGHPEIEMGLAELARASGDPKYLREAKYMLDVRGRRNPDGTVGVVGGRAYHQDHLPFRELDRMIGHAVRHLYLNAGATDVYAETGDATLLPALDRTWEALTRRQLYVTGGAGARHEGEAFGADYELPNTRAYTETCAAIALIMWAWRMLGVTGDATYADVMERALYNGFLSGLGLDGLSYFYVNPLADDGNHRRKPWYECACCPPNVARMIASLPGYFYNVDRSGEAWVHLYAESEADLALPGGGTARIVQHTGYPWDGDVEIAVSGGCPALHVRIPGWADGARLQVDGKEVAATPGSYTLVATSGGSATIRLHLPMPPRWIESHPYAAENRDSVALARGPLVYCVEGVDHPGVDLRDLRVRPAAGVEAVQAGDLLGGIVVLTGQASVAPPDAGWEGQLYRPLRAGAPAGAAQPVTLKAIPYYAWANREPGQMRVWLQTES